jgi:hypothetical protein
LIPGRPKRFTNAGSVLKLRFIFTLLNTRTHVSKKETFSQEERELTEFVEVASVDEVGTSPKETK